MGTQTVALMTPLEPGRVEVSLLGVTGARLFPNYQQNGLELLIVRAGSESILREWPNLDGDNYVTVPATNARQRSVNFNFNLGPEIVDPMGSDNSGNYILRIKDARGIPVSFGVSIQGQLRMSSSAGTHTQRQRSAYAPNISQGTNDATFGSAAGTSTAGTTQDPNEAQPFDPSNSTYARHQSDLQNQRAMAHNTSSVGPLVMKIVGVICVLALLIGAGLFLMKLFSQGDAVPAAQEVNQPAEPEQPVEEEATQEAEPEPEPVPESESTKPVFKTQACDLNARSVADSALISECFKAQPETDDLLLLLAESLKQERCEVALRILRTKGRTSSGTIFAYIFAQYAMPNSKYTSSCISKDQQEAQYWAERVVLDKNFDRKQAQATLDKFAQ